VEKELFFEGNKNTTAINLKEFGLLELGFEYVIQKDNLIF
jgi:hypothetical protein